MEAPKFSAIVDEALSDVQETCPTLLPAIVRLLSLRIHLGCGSKHSSRKKTSKSDGAHSASDVCAGRGRAHSTVSLGVWVFLAWTFFQCGRSPQPGCCQGRQVCAQAQFETPSPHAPVRQHFHAHLVRFCKLKRKEGRDLKW